MDIRLSGFLFFFVFLIKLWTLEAKLRTHLERYHDHLVPVFAHFLKMILEEKRFCEGRVEAGLVASKHCMRSKNSLKGLYLMFHVLTKPPVELKRSTSVPGDLHKLHKDFGGGQYKYGIQPTFGVSRPLTKSQEQLFVPRPITKSQSQGALYRQSPVRTSSQLSLGHPGYASAHGSYAQLPQGQYVQVPHGSYAQLPPEEPPVQFFVGEGPEEPGA